MHRLSPAIPLPQLRLSVAPILQQPGWRPGDIFMACAFARTAAQPCRAVVREWSRDHADGWADVARRLQAKARIHGLPGLREDLKETYSRWSRPLQD